MWSLTVFALFGSVGELMVIMKVRVKFRFGKSGKKFVIKCRINLEEILIF